MSEGNKTTKGRDQMKTSINHNNRRNSLPEPHWDPFWSALLDDAAKARIVQRYRLIASGGAWILGLFIVWLVADTTLRTSIANAINHAVPMTYTILKAAGVEICVYVVLLICLVVWELPKAKTA